MTDLPPLPDKWVFLSELERVPGQCLSDWQLLDRVLPDGHTGVQIHEVWKIMDDHVDAGRCRCSPSRAGRTYYIPQDNIENE